MSNGISLKKQTVILFYLSKAFIGFMLVTFGSGLYSNVKFLAKSTLLELMS